MSETCTLLQETSDLVHNNRAATKIPHNITLSAFYSPVNGTQCACLGESIFKFPRVKQRQNCASHSVAK